MKRTLALALLLGAALAGPCGERPYTLETEEGLLGGENLTYDGEVLVFEGRACLEREGLYLEAPAIRYLQEEGNFRAEGLGGEAQGWRLGAERLEGKTLYGVRLEKGRLKARAERLHLETPPLGQGILPGKPRLPGAGGGGLFYPGGGPAQGLPRHPLPLRGGGAPGDGGGPL